MGLNRAVGNGEEGAQPETLLKGMCVGGRNGPGPMTGHYHT